MLTPCTAAGQSMALSFFPSRTSTVSGTTCSPFHPLTPPQGIMRLIAAVQWMEVPRGTVLQQAGTPLHGMYFVKQGQVAVYLPSRFSPGGTASQRPSAAPGSAAAAAAAAAATAGAGAGAATAMSGRHTPSHHPHTPHRSHHHPMPSPLPGRTNALGSGTAPGAGAAGSGLGLGSGALELAPGATWSQAMAQVALLGPGEHFGEDALTAGGRHQVRARVRAQGGGAGSRWYKGEGLGERG